MPVFKVDIEKQWSTEFFSNRYFVIADTLADAHLQAMEQILLGEREIHLTGVVFTKVRTSDNVPDTENFITAAVNLPGLRVGSGGVLPLFNVLRVDYTAGVGRPSRKYFRLPLDEGNTENGQVLQPLVTLVNNTLTTRHITNADLVDVDGDPLVGVSVFNIVAMRQLRRGSKRRTQPIIQ